ncbi:DUF6134 family protein [Azospirillum thermophilum]|uniref:DUF3108 domain-containing protein n=1 Tax=Azospirillum thermophilum TaxID=2202148 RepID=A0A2S2CQW4_9PROT|nr:DUF6134 family protein [Azospirillum thermophilum]AWK86876.1 hypothetical protein DEW08_12125 [Azospirillum thermophilum]
MTKTAFRALVTGATLTAAALALAAPAAAAARTLSYQILMGDDPIGTEEVKLDQQGDQTKVTVTATTRVKVLFINFRYDHQREELWKGSTLQSLRGKTDDDGTPHVMELTRQGSGYVMTVDGKSSELPGNALPLTLWTPEVLKHPLLLSVIDGARYTVNSQTVGKETVEAGGKAQEATRHRISGEVDRELWYAADGTLLKTRFKRSGYDITYVLK